MKRKSDINKAVETKSQPLEVRRTSEPENLRFSSHSNEVARTAKAISAPIDGKARAVENSMLFMDRNLKLEAGLNAIKEELIELQTDLSNFLNFVTKSLPLEVRRTSEPENLRFSSHSNEVARVELHTYGVSINTRLGDIIQMAVDTKKDSRLEQYLGKRGTIDANRNNNKTS